MRKKNKKQKSWAEISSFEKGTFSLNSKPQIALGYPSTYQVAISSLGFQTVYRILNESNKVCCERFFTDYLTAPNNVPLTVETQTPINKTRAIAFSIACETQLLEIVKFLEAAKIPPLAQNRNQMYPPIIIGGPLMMVDPCLCAPLADVVVCGEGEEALEKIAEIVGFYANKNDILDNLQNIGLGLWCPQLNPQMPGYYSVKESFLPAYSVTWSPKAGLKDLFLVEIARGCKRKCSFCVLTKCPSFLQVEKEKIFSSVPLQATDIGLVGAAVTDHVQLNQIVEHFVAKGQRVSLSSLRADKINTDLLSLLIKGGLKTMTIAADGSSEKIRRNVHKGITHKHLIDAAQISAQKGLKKIKMYSIIGLPGETDEDISEFSKLALEMAGIIRLSVAIEAFVPKPGTPLQKEKMESERMLKHRLALLKKFLSGKVEVLPTSIKASWIEWKLSHGGKNSALAAIKANALGGDYGAWKKAIEEEIE